MRKLVNGIVEFRKKMLPTYRDTFRRLALGQRPDALYIGCSDSRVAVNLFASTDPGDLFVVRNVGNLVPRDILKAEDSSVGAAIEYAVNSLLVKNIIVCGHSECGAMRALCSGVHEQTEGPLSDWLKNGAAALEDLRQRPDFAEGHSDHNRLSQLNVLRQIDRIRQIPTVRDAIENRGLGIHGWWFELEGANVYAFEDAADKFVLIDEAEAERILARLSQFGP